ncbi:MAG: hypothetical protein IJ635_11275 [Bacteroidaceae bacterium]|nr:hypothetical protein [Bacteroidaceae bacterium]
MKQLILFFYSFMMASTPILARVQPSQTEVFPINPLTTKLVNQEQLGDSATTQRPLFLREPAKEQEDKLEDLPQLVDFNSVEICHEHNQDVLRCCTYYLTHRLDAAQMSDAANYIFKWSISSADVKIVMSVFVSELFTHQEHMAYVMAYMAASSYHCLTKQMKSPDEDTYIEIVTTLLHFYEQNKDLSGDVKILEEYLHLQKKNKLVKQLKEEFQIIQQFQ